MSRRLNGWRERDEPHDEETAGPQETRQTVGRAFIVWRHCHLLTFVVVSADLRPACSLFPPPPPNALVYYTIYVYYIASFLLVVVLLLPEKRWPMAGGGVQSRRVHPAVCTIFIIIVVVVPTRPGPTRAARRMFSRAAVTRELCLSSRACNMSNPDGITCVDTYLAPRGNEKTLS